MAPKVLTRCELCKNWQAIYIVDDPQYGRIKVCHKCWQSRYAPTQGGTQKTGKDTVKPALESKPHGSRK